MPQTTCIGIDTRDISRRVDARGDGSYKTGNADAARARSGGRGIKGANRAIGSTHKADMVNANKSKTKTAVVLAIDLPCIVILTTCGRYDILEQL